MSINKTDTNVTLTGHHFLNGLRYLYPLSSNVFAISAFTGVHLVKSPFLFSVKGSKHFSTKNLTTGGFLKASIVWKGICKSTNTSWNEIVVTHESNIKRPTKFRAPQSTMEAGIAASTLYLK